MGCGGEGHARTRRRAEKGARVVVPCRRAGAALGGKSWARCPGAHLRPGSEPPAWGRGAGVAGQPSSGSGDARGSSTRTWWEMDSDETLPTIAVGPACETPARSRVHWAHQSARAFEPPKSGENEKSTLTDASRALERRRRGLRGEGSFFSYALQLQKSRSYIGGVCTPSGFGSYRTARRRTAFTPPASRARPPWT